MLSEKLGNWHFWLTFIGDEPDVLPDALLGNATACRAASTRTTPARAGTSFNLMSTCGAFIQRVGTLIFVYNFFEQPQERRDRRQRSVGRADARVVDPVAAAGVQLRA